MRAGLFLALCLAVFDAFAVGLGWLMAGWLGVVVFGVFGALTTCATIWMMALQAVGSIRAERRSLRTAEESGSRRRVWVARRRVALARWRQSH